MHLLKCGYVAERGSLVRKRMFFKRKESRHVECDSFVQTEVSGFNIVFF